MERFVPFQKDDPDLKLKEIVNIMNTLNVDFLKYCDNRKKYKERYEMYLWFEELIESSDEPIKKIKQMKQNLIKEFRE